MVSDAVWIVGGGPAGLAAAEVISTAGVPVVITEAKPSLGRKFLMAGKSGLNLTKDEDVLPTFPAWLRPIVAQFDADAVQDWARGLGQEVFTGSSGRVFPKAMKGAPLLRAWLKRLQSQGVTAQTRWRWTGWEQEALTFDTPNGPQRVTPRATVLAMGGASWSRLGSDGLWADILQEDGATLSPFRPTNMGFDAAWSPHMARFAGHAVKNVALSAGTERIRGEFVITDTGVEGSAVYALSRTLRDTPQLMLDLMPDHSHAALRARLAKPRGKATLTNHLRKTLKLDPLKLALLREAGPLPEDIAARVKACPIPLTGPRPIDEAISTAGGLHPSALTETLMLKHRPGTFAAGEMLDWEAPTGGYLLTGCFATGRHAGRCVLTYLSSS